MPPAAETRIQSCNCLALRQAARHVSQIYDQHLAPTGLRTTQFSILAHLHELGPLTINALARELVMDRTTLGRTMLPLERDGLIRVESAATDKRRKELKLTAEGAARLRAAARLWRAAQASFEAAYGSARASTLRRELRAVVGEESARPR
jgi:DNA-binding MarR family transcriptional regulator